LIDHVSLGSHRYADAVAFYGRVLAPLGHALLRDTGAEAAFGTAERWGFFVYPAQPAESIRGAGMHLALAAPSRAAVRAAHELALAAGGEDIFTPRLRPDINDTYYGAMFRDLDGHRIEVLTHAA
jgi:catechol 2,3-dioxygenase-like lactoylglutathione lyase family enzyme